MGTSEDVIGFHGTSLLSTIHLMQSGKLLPSVAQGSANHLGFLYFFPNKDAFPNHPLRDSFLPFAEAAKLPCGYAHDSTRKHYFLRELGLDPSVSENYLSAAYLLDIDMMLPGDPFAHSAYQPLRARLNSIGISDEMIKKAAQDAWRRAGKGVVVTLHKDCLGRFEVSDGDDADTGLMSDLKLRVPDGLPIEFLTGIEPLGDEKFMFFERLQGIIEGRITNPCT